MKLYPGSEFSVNSSSPPEQKTGHGVVSALVLLAEQVKAQSIVVINKPLTCWLEAFSLTGWTSS